MRINREVKATVRLCESVRSTIRSKPRKSVKSKATYSQISATSSVGRESLGGSARPPTRFKRIRDPQRVSLHSDPVSQVARTGTTQIDVYWSSEVMR